eukprot:4775024-Amphidinium_carterae.1
MGWTLTLESAPLIVEASQERTRHSPSLFNVDQVPLHEQPDMESSKRQLSCGTQATWEFACRPRS